MLNHHQQGENKLIIRSLPFMPLRQWDVKIILHLGSITFSVVYIRLFGTCWCSFDVVVAVEKYFSSKNGSKGCLKTPITLKGIYVLVNINYFQIIIYDFKKITKIYNAVRTSLVAITKLQIDYVPPTHSPTTYICYT